MAEEVAAGAALVVDPADPVALADAIISVLTDQGLSLVRMLEPAPPEGFLERNDAYRAARHIPRLLVLVCEKR